VASVELPTWRSYTLGVEDVANFTAIQVGIQGSTLGDGGGGGSLASYCSGEAEIEVGIGTRVEADWNGYGTNYPGDVEKTHKDGSIDVHYDDGMTEEGIPEGRYRILKGESAPAKKPTNDPACLLLGDVEELKTRLARASDSLQSWLTNRQKERTGEETQTPPPPSGFVPSPPVAAVPGSPGPAVMVPSDDPTKDAKLKELKQKLVDTDAWVAGLEHKIAENDVKLHGDASAQDDNPGAFTIDNLIQQYEQKIKTREDYGHYLEKRLVEQGKHLHEAVTLDDIARDVDAINLDIAGLQQKRDNIAKSGTLDPELKVATDKIIRRGKKLGEKLKILMGLDVKAKQQAAEDAAAEEARMASGGSPAPATARASLADDEVFAAASELQAEVKNVEQGTEELDHGVAPGGTKWWRYRYEHAFVEAILVIMISMLMLLWERCYYHLRRKSYGQSSHHAERAEAAHMSIGTIHLAWLERFAGELMCCTMVFLSIWLLIKFGCLDLLTLCLKSDEAMRYPTTGSEYAELAIDLCVVLFWAIFFYFLMTLALVQATSNCLKEWAQWELHNREEAQKSVLGSRNVSAVSKSMGLGFADDSVEYDTMREDFVSYLNSDSCKDLKADLLREQQAVAAVRNLQVASITEASTELNFPFFKYLRQSSRGVEVLFNFGTCAWLQIIVTFVIFMVLHFTLHIEYVRVMAGFIVLLLLQLILIGYFIWSMKDVSRAKFTSKNDSIHNRFNTEGIILHMLFYNVFMICYGLARVFFQPFMWELHFEMCCWLLVFTVTMVLVFCCFVAPLLPIFVVIMSLPPFLDFENEKSMRACFHDKVDASEYLTWDDDEARSRSEVATPREEAA